MRLDGPWSEAITRHTAAVQAARSLGDRLGEANALDDLGDIQGLAGEFPASAQALEQALAMYRDLGDRLGQANALRDLAYVRGADDYPAAAQALDQALAIACDIGDRGSEVEMLNRRGTLHRVSGDLVRAGMCHQQAMALARAIGSPWDEAHALAGLGRCALAVGRTAEAEDKLLQALEIFQRIGAAEVADVAAELDALTEEQPRKGKPSAATWPNRIICAPRAGPAAGNRTSRSIADLHASGLQVHAATADQAGPRDRACQLRRRQIPDALNTSAGRKVLSGNSRESALLVRG